MKRFILLITFIIPLFIFFSCNNFLDAGKISEDIKNTIEKNNAKQVNVVVACPEEIGQVYPNNEQSVKLGFDFEVQFILNSKNFYICDLSTVFEAVNKIDQSKSMNEYVQFSAIPQTAADAKDNIYRVNVKVLAETENLLIRPKCQALPAIERIIVNSNSGTLYASSPIYVKFNMEMTGSKLDFDTISLTYNGIDMTDYFYPPVLNEQKDILIIQTRSMELKNYIENTLRRDRIDLKVTFDESITVAKDGINIPLKQNEHSTFTVLYNTNIESTPPSLYSALEPSVITAKEIDIDTAHLLEDQYRFVETPAEDNLRLYRTKQYIYVYGHYFDAESGVNKVTVYTYRQPEYDKDIDEGWKSKEYYVDPSNSNFRIDTEGHAYFCIPHEVIGRDGKYLVKYVVSDACGFSAPETDTVTFYKETALSGGLEITNLNPVNPQTFNNSLNKLKIKKIAGFDPTDDTPIYGFNITGANSIKYYFGEFPLEIVYKDKSGVERTKEFEINDDDPENLYYFFDLDVDVTKIAGCTFTIRIKNDIGNEFIQTYAIPSEPVIVNMNLSEEDFYRPEFASKTADTAYKVYCYDEDNNFREHTKKWGEYSPFDRGKNYYVSMGYNLQGPLRLVTDSLETEVDTTVVQLKTPVYEQTEDNPREFYITLILKEGEWEKYDEIYVSSYQYFSEPLYFDKTTGTVKFYMPVDFFKSQTSIWLYAIKKDGNLVRNSYMIQALTDAQILDLDSTPPYLKVEYKDELYTFKIREEDTEIQNVSITFANENAQEPKGFGWNKDSPNPYDHSYPTNPLACYRAETASSYLNMIKKYHYQEVYWQDDYIDYIELTVPAWMIAEGGGLNISAVDTAGNEFYEYFFPDCNFYGMVTWNWKDKDHIDIYSTEYWGEGSIETKIKIQKWDNGWKNLSTPRTDKYEDENGVEQEVTFYIDYEKNAEYNSNSRNTDINFSTIISDPGYYRVYSSNYYFIPRVYYEHEANSTYTGGYDFLISNPGNSKSVLVMSDGPVFLCTYSASISYEEALTWSTEAWEHYTRATNETIMDDFSVDHELKVHFTEDQDNQVPKGHCFVVVAYFADGTKAKSDVFIKY